MLNLLIAQHAQCLSPLPNEIRFFSYMSTLKKSSFFFKFSEVVQNGETFVKMTEL